MQNPMRILVRAPNWIGDHVMALPFYLGLRAHYPDAHLTLLHTSQITGLRLGNFDDHWELPSGWRRPRHLLAFAREVRSREYRVAFSLPASWSTNLLLAFSRIPHRIGFDEGGSGSLLTHAIRWRGARAQRHKSRQYADLLGAVGGAGVFRVPSQDLTTPHLKRIVLAPGAALGLREWPYVELLAFGLSRRFPEYELLLVGGVGEKKWQSRLGRLRLPNFDDRVGQTSLETLQQLLSTASVVIANDSGIAHVAATVVGKPTLVLYGPGNPDYIRPMGEHARALYVERLGCRPCDSTHCSGGFGYQTCLRAIPFARVLGAVESLLATPTCSAKFTR
ncbi:MAG: glycosyltransferase family 9 protein [Bdellovibrionales bacterium]|nr:glycosyltransferase family 9 protein [Bdellovibrionales bacterium]